MTEKYYTPTIEEFHVGFEFEVLYENVGWAKESLAHRPEVVTLPYMNLENIRVKYLDREDIESLGWKKHGERYYYSSKTVPLRINQDGSCDHEDCSMGIDSDYRAWINAGNNHFTGTINNKSELKKLMQQLNLL